MSQTAKIYRLKESRKGLPKGFILQVAASCHPDSSAIKKALVAQTNLSEREAGEITYPGYWNID